MSEENKTQNDNELANELTDDELDQVAGGGPSPHMITGNLQPQIGLFKPTVQVAAGDVNGDNILEVNGGTL